MGETEPTERDVICRVRRGHHARERQPETPETDAIWLITQRSQVQILPSLIGGKKLSSTPSGKGHPGRESTPGSKGVLRSLADGLRRWSGSVSA